MNRHDVKSANALRGLVFAAMLVACWDPSETGETDETTTSASTIGSTTTGESATAPKTGQSAPSGTDAPGSTTDVVASSTSGDATTSTTSGDATASTTRGDSIGNWNRGGGEWLSATGQSGAGGGGASYATPTATDVMMLRGGRGRHGLLVVT